MIGIVGSGYMADCYAKALNYLGCQASLFLISGSHRSLKYCSDNLFKSTTSLDSFLRSGISHVIVTTPELVTPLILQGLRLSGVKVLVEKPAGHSYKSSLELLDSYKKADTRAEVYVAFNRRFYTSFQAAFDRLQYEKSCPRYVSILDQQSLQDCKSLGHPDDVSMHMMFANSVHLIDLARVICRGEVAESTITGKWEKRDGCVVASFITFSSGDRLSYQCFWGSPAPWRIEINTDKTRFLMKPLESLYIQEKGSRQEKEVVSNDLDPVKAGLVSQLQEFLKEDSSKSLLCSLVESFRTTQLVADIYSDYS